MPHYVCCTHHQTSLLKATLCTDRVIAAVAQEVERVAGVGENKWDDLNSTVRTLLVPQKGLHWFQSLELTDPYGLHWHVVVAERAQCDRGFFVPTEFKVKIGRRGDWWCRDW